MTFTEPALFVVPFLVMAVGLILFLTADPAKPRPADVGKIMFAIGLFYVLGYVAAHGAK